MKINLIKYIKKVLGITALETENQFLKENYELILQRFFKQERILENVTEDNRTIIRQIKLINDDFMVGVDLGGGRDVSTVSIIRKG